MLQVAFLPIDKWRRLILQNPELYLGGVAEPFWVNSLGAAVWVGEQVFVGRWVKLYFVLSRVCKGRSSRCGTAGTALKILTSSVWP